MADENIEAAQQKLYDAILMHALDLERTNRGLVFDMKDHVTKSAVSLGTKLSERLEGLTDGELQRLARYRVGGSMKGLPSRVVGVINVIDAWSESFDASTLALWEAEAPEFMQTEMDFARDSLDGVMVGEVGAVGVTAAAAYKEAMASPMLGSFFEEDLANATAYSKTIVYNTIREGISNGETTPAIVKSIVGTKSLQYKDGTINTTRNSVTSLVRTARTHMSTTAYDITYRALGVEKVIFIATMDGRTTFQCSSLDQNVYDADGNYPRPPLHRGCLIGDTHVTSGSVISDVSKRWFDGDVVVIRTASGRELTGTPNHPILTSRGWVPMERLNEVGNVASYSGGKWVGLADGEHQDVVPTIHDVSEAFFGAGEMFAVPVPVATEDFHGDGAGSDVAVVGANSLLNRQASDALLKHSEEVSLVSGDVDAKRALPSLGRETLLGVGFDATLCSDVCVTNQVGDLFGCRDGHPSGLLFRLISDMDAALSEDGVSMFVVDGKPFSDRLEAETSFVDFTDRVLDGLVDEGPLPASLDAEMLEGGAHRLGVDSQLGSDLTDGHLPADVEIDNIVSYEVRKFSGHVYNLETEYGYYVANGIITHNCRSTIAPYLGGDVNGVRPYVKAFKPLQQIKKADRPANMVGNVKADTSMVEFLKRPSNSAFAREYFGETRYKLFKSGKITLKQMIRADGSRMSIDELRTKYPKDFKAIFGE